MPIHPLEAVADAIMHREGWAAGSHSNRNRNPGNLRPVVPVMPHDAHNYRTFDTLVEGYNALIAELTAKFTGHNVHGIGPSSTLQDLIDVYAPRADKNNPSAYALDVAAWCTVALGFTITPQSPLTEIWPRAPFFTATATGAPSGEGA
jgi:hypothetical protein